MGHYASEMDPEWDARIARSSRIHKLKKKISSVPLSKFQAEDAFHLVNLFSSGDSGKIPEDVLSRFETIADLYWL